MKASELNELSYLSVPIPEDIQRAKDYGDISLAKKLIAHKLNKSQTSATLKRRLEGELAILTVLEANQYPFDEQEACRLMEEAFENFEPQELEDIVVSADVEWIYHEGQKYYHRRFIENLVKTRRDYYERYRFEEGNTIDNERQTELDDNIVVMKKAKKRRARIQLKQSIAPKERLTNEEGPFLAHLPLPRANGHVKQSKVIATKGNVQHIDQEDAIQRTIAFQTSDASELSFEVIHEYEIEAVYHDLFAIMEEKDFPKTLTEEEQQRYHAELQEKSPHIMFTEFLRTLLAELTTAEMTLVEKAFKIYEFVTTQVNYSFMREYYTIPNISEYCAMNQKGDCGVQALLFITLCRMAGIPAKWESGLYVSEYTQGCHDWAKFYLPTIGWVYADASFGGSAYRGGNETRWKYYFGNLDIFRMPANDDIQAAFTVNKKQLRGDPIDNQRGEFESAIRGYRYNELDWGFSLVSFELFD
ncbi:transglutaminase-like domain-containing protein [Candidatus Enterococcus willemsii]|uniref:Transglutaminase n=1 Tax=Candidatus Enterococcus willemsii TaxID=1857215 RepID=A0ABQ6YX03_9ENTE|nr:transglutaminase-like domain-containing protein [Enterococcus sp. CU12B]KAF1302243.1 transglutaminase [Enterococcus sp. CU12B]